MRDADPVMNPTKSALLTSNEEKRYARQMMLPGWGREAQEKLKQSTVFIAGAGGLGSPASIYLAAAGIGTLRIADMDTVELSNLNRQIMHSTSRVGNPKVESARFSLNGVNEHTYTEALHREITTENALEMISGSAAIVDCMDNLSTRFVLNRVARQLRIPLIFGAVWGMEGRLSVFLPGQAACLQCVFPEAPPKETFPVVGAGPGVIGCMQAMETLKSLTGCGRPLSGRMLLWDGSTGLTRYLPLKRDPNCPECGDR